MLIPRKSEGSTITRNRETAEKVHYYVGVMNHGKYYNLWNGPDVKASVKIQLKEGVHWLPCNRGAIHLSSKNLCRREFFSPGLRRRL